MACGSPLSYLEKAEDLECDYCGQTGQGYIKCPNGHYVCESCHNRGALKMIEDIIFSSASTDPFEIAGDAMSLPGLPMLGCEHAYIAGGVLMAALKNMGIKGVADEGIKEVFNRTKRQAHGGYCGLTGVCGIAPAIGACVAVLTGSRCGKDEEQRLTMEAVTRVSRAITDLTGPSCCKAYTWASLSVATDYLKERFGINLSGDRNIICKDSVKHPHGCRETKCPYFSDIPISA